MKEEDDWCRIKEKGVKKRRKREGRGGARGLGICEEEKRGMNGNEIDCEKIRKKRKRRMTGVE